MRDLNEGVYDAGGVMPSGEIRQYLYVLNPKDARKKRDESPGSVIPLGRLDISWTSAFGETGRLLTSVHDPPSLCFFGLTDSFHSHGLLLPRLNLNKHRLFPCLPVPDRN